LPSWEPAPSVALAARLAHAGADVTLVVRDPARAALIAGQGIACREGAVSCRPPAWPGLCLMAGSMFWSWR
jgi:NAD(P)-dependent dehydrogenase (short-subunit alcohol dehydrogenase family)